ncbi:hypothetical protein [Spongiimicrobium sp. 3-5]|uniref:hypothetical protein n=1 Tax=Spongiimicrobium sp. 3-5 TaxID=3332596 RepID=UPI00397FC751
MRIKLLVISFFAFLLLSCSKEDSASTSIPENQVLTEQIAGVPAEENKISESTLKTLNWLRHMQMSNGLLESTENSNFVSLYDNSLAALIFISNGEYGKAERIFDFFNTRIEVELLNGTGGFYQFRNKNGENGSRTWIGDNAWLLIALHNYRKITGNEEYDTLIVALENWLRSLQDDDGGLYGGHNADGSKIHKITEGIITTYIAVEGYDDFHKNLLNYLKEQRWDANEKIIVAWPENPSYNNALDLHSLGYQIFNDFPASSLSNADRYLTKQIATVSGEAVNGYCFDQDKDVVWLEGTSQMAMAYRHANMDHAADRLLEEIEKTFIASTLFPYSQGVPYASNHGSTFGSSDLWDHADLTPAVSSCTWYLFARLGFDPFDVLRKKEVLAEDKFWTVESAL